MSDIELYEKWCEYNENNLPISFAEFCYKQGRADAIAEVMKMAKFNIHFESIVEEERFMQMCEQMQKGANND